MPQKQNPKLSLHHWLTAAAAEAAANDTEDTDDTDSLSSKWLLSQ